MRTFELLIDKLNCFTTWLSITKLKLRKASWKWSNLAIYFKKLIKDAIILSIIVKIWCPYTLQPKCPFGMFYVHLLYSTYQINMLVEECGV